MGSVYLVRELQLERLLALKMLLVQLEGSNEQRTRFKQEGKLLASLSHPNLVKCYRLGLWKNNLYMAMEFLEGNSLREILLTDGHISVNRCLNIAAQVCKGMSCAHAAGIIHRDIKPGNIFLHRGPDNTTDNVKILDFGLARVVNPENGEDLHLTRTGAVVGTVYYMSPEQCTGKPIDNRSDIYALGCVMYKALTGQAPFDADNVVNLMEKHVKDPTPPLVLPDEQKPPRGLENVISKAMEKNPKLRYQSMDELYKDIQLLLADRGEEVSAIPPKPPDTAAQKKRQEVIFGTALFLCSLTVIAWQYKSRFVDPEFNHPPSTLQSRLVMDPKVSLRRIALALPTFNASSSSAQRAKLYDMEKTLDQVFARIPRGDAVMRYHGHMTKATYYRTLRQVEPKSNALEQENSEFAQALDLVRETLGQNSRIEGIVLGCMAETARQTNNLKKAEPLYNQALQLISNVDPTPEMTLDKELPGAEPFSARGHYELALAQCAKAKKNYQKAEYWLRASRVDSPQLYGDGLTAVRELLEVFLLEKKSTEFKRLLKQTEEKVRTQQKSHVLSDDRAAVVYAVAAMAHSYNRATDNALGDINKAVNLVDSTAESENVSFVKEALKQVKTVVTKEKQKANIAEMERKLTKYR